MKLCTKLDDPLSGCQLPENHKENHFRATRCPCGSLITGNSWALTSGVSMHVRCAAKKMDEEAVLEASLTRPSFLDVYFRLAENLAARSTCLRGKVGCAVVSPDFRRVLAVGYNGNVAGRPNTCDRVGEEAVGNCGCLHAEENATINCDVPRMTPKLVLSTHLPCVQCAKRIVNVGGVERVFYLRDYRLRDGLAVLDRAGIPHTQHILGGGR